jgi:hypothetical protein
MQLSCWLKLYVMAVQIIVRACQSVITDWHFCFLIENSETRVVVSINGKAVVGVKETAIESNPYRTVSPLDQAQTPPVPAEV